MEHETKLQQKILRCCKIILSAFLLFPMISHAHLISITGSPGFPSTIPTATPATATYKITNISSKAKVTAIDQSNFATDSGLSITQSTCKKKLLAPGDVCFIQVSLQAQPTAKTISALLKQWAKPSADGVQYPIKIKVISTPHLPTITLTPVESINPSLPMVRAPIVAHSGGYWLIVSGSTGNFHDFNNNFITDIYVFNPENPGVLHSVSVSSTNLDPEIQRHLASTSTQFLQNDDILYIIGGYYTEDNHLWTTLQTLTAIKVTDMIAAIIAGNTSNLNQYARVRTDIPEFAVTGGQLGKINEYFYLTYGQKCSIGGNYCTNQQYTNSIYKFIMDPTLELTKIVSTASHLDKDNSGWRRRDYNLVPYKLGDRDALFAMAGPFTQGLNALVWTNGIMFDSNLSSNDNYINQQANQYSSAFLSMYSANRNISYVATFSGLSNLYWSTNGLEYDKDTPYGNILDLISTDAAGNVQEFANVQPVCASGTTVQDCLYMGLNATFIPAPGYYDNRFILQLDKLSPDQPTLVGYIYGGLQSSKQSVFENPDDADKGPSHATNQVYAVWVTPLGPVANWQSITDLYPGN